MSISPRIGPASVALAAVLLVCAVSLSAHRLDEYLQAARLSVAVDRVSLEIDLTAGVSMAPAVFSSIDADRSGGLSPEEIQSYARQVIGSLVLTVDDRPVRPALDAAQGPSWDDMRQGVGAIRVRASAPVPPQAAGNHRLFFRNTHRPDGSVYLANALVPADRRIEITDQRRDVDQRELTIDYRVVPGSTWSRTTMWGWFAGLAVAGAIAAAVRSRAPLRPATPRRR